MASLMGEDLKPFRVCDYLAFIKNNGRKVFGNDAGTFHPVRKTIGDFFFNPLVLNDFFVSLKLGHTFPQNGARFFK
jgi:hypothetical protein